MLWWLWFVASFGLGIWLGAWATVYCAPLPHTIVCALCRAELPHQSNVAQRKED